jgi:predicted component of type VI protein secretion system
VLDLFVKGWRRNAAQGEVIFARYADDFIMGFEKHSDAVRFVEELRARLAKFDLELHPQKTRLIEFGRFAAERRKRKRKGKPETFDSLGFTHICSTKKDGRFTVRRQTVRKRLRAKLQKLAAQLRKFMHQAIPQLGKWLALVLRGHFNDYGVPYNSEALSTFRHRVTRLWFRVLRRRSQRSRITWDRMRKLEARWLPAPRIVHPFPDQRLAVKI